MKRIFFIFVFCAGAILGCVSEQKTTKPSVDAEASSDETTPPQPEKNARVLLEADSVEVFNFLKNSDSVRKHVEAILGEHKKNGKNEPISSTTTVGKKKVVITVFFEMNQEKNQEIKKIFESGTIAFSTKTQSFLNGESFDYLVFVFFENLPEARLLQSALMQELFHVQTYEAPYPEKQEYLSEIVSMYSDHYQSYIAHRLANYFSGKLEGAHYLLVKEGYKKALQKCNLVLSERLEITDTDCECIRKNF